MGKIKDFVKKETVLVIAAILAVASMLVICPDKRYLGYIDFRTLAILFSLMAVVAGFRKVRLFDMAAKAMLKKSKSFAMVVMILVMLCFFSSMFITNDVALITFVPLTIITLNEAKKCKMIIPVVVLQTLAANLGSMLTPLGNPQNLYLYGIANMSFWEFIKLMIPFSATSLIMLAVCSFMIGKREAASGSCDIDAEATGKFSKSEKVQCGIYTILFLVSLMTVLRVMPFQMMFAIVLLAVIVMDMIYKQGVLKSVDMSLIFTFVFLFVFIGNIGRISSFRNFLEGIISGREVISAVAASQVISNVPAAILLSGFTDKYDKLIIGTNLGGLGTLIASMASLISYKYIAANDGESKGKYFVEFTIMNVVFLAVLLGIYVLINVMM